MKQFFYICLAGCLFLPLVVFSQSGTLDNTFGTGGKRIEQMGVASFDMSALVQQPDGKILMGGSAVFSAMGYDVVLARFLADGSPDLSFGNNGRVVVMNPASYDFLASMLLLPSGKILVACNSAFSETVLLRFNSNGTPDITFDGDGKLTVNGIYFSAHDMEVQPDGKIVLFGTGGNYPYQLVVFRYTETGVADTGFDGDGMVSVGLTGSSLLASSMALQPDGKMVLIGYNSQWGEQGEVQTNYLYRLTATGSIDNSFGDGKGSITLQVGEFTEQLTQVLVLSDGKILLGGYGTLWDGSLKYSMVVRLTSTGSYDMTLWGRGYRVISSATGFFSFGQLLYDAGNVILPGAWRNPSGMYSFAMVRLNDYGQYDENFGTNGLATTGSSDFSQLALVVAKQGDGKYIAGGYSSNGTYYQLGLVRMLTTGVPDETFGNNAVAAFTISTMAANDKATMLQVSADNSFFVGGEYANALSTFGFVRKYLPNGTPDVSFGSDGRFNLPLPFVSTISSLLELPGGKLLVLATYNDFVNGQQLALYRLLSNGTVDIAFGNDGKVLFGDAAAADYAIGMGRQSNGKIIVLAVRSGWSTEDLFLYRFTTDGVGDGTFGTSGRIQLQGLKLDAYNEYGFNQHMVIQPDDRIVVTGYVEGTGNNNVGIVRYTANGTTDGTFNSGNPLNVELANDESGITLALQPNGKIVVAGTSRDYATYDEKLVLVRLNENGTLDQSFDADGWLVAAVPSFQGVTPSAVRILPNQQILVSATATSTGYNTSMVVMRLNENGSFDPQFGTQGFAVLSNTGDGYDAVLDMNLQTDGKILLVGKVENNEQEDAVIVRLNQTIATGVNDHSQPLATLRVTPNPIREQVTLSAAKLENGQYHLRVFTVEGRLADSRMFTVRNNTLQWNIDASTWPDGVLLMTITGRNSQKTFRVIKE